jgi:hypothetical protein
MSDFDLPAGQEYKGPSGIARESNWLTNEDLPHDRDVVVTIEKVVVRKNVKFQGGRTKKVYLSLKFEGKERELGINATNRKVMNALFTSKTAAWKGKTVALYVEQNVRYPDGTTGPAVRIRPKRIDSPAEAPPEGEKQPAGAPTDGGKDGFDPERDKDLLPDA